MSLQALSSQLLYIPRTYPFSFSLILTSAKTGAADYMTQIYIEKRETLDIKRNVAFWVFGAWFLGGVQYYFYCNIYKAWFPRAESFALLPLREKLKDKAGQSQVVQQVAIDMLLFEPFVYFPCFYQNKIRIQGGTGRDAWNAYVRNVQADVIEFWKYGIPAFTFNFTFCPMYLRIPFIALYSFGWTAYLSFLRGAER
mmetsp:Transcript_20334/g.26351  ORF Transcript_20334/g.26351 Transcript_20334/m.26351 type:complete len:197 (-) Transcript_20334:114-704(-)